MAKNITLNELLQVILNDISIKLLKEDDKLTFKKKLYTQEEITEQLTKTYVDVYDVLKGFGYEMDSSIIANPNYIKNLLQDPFSDG